MPSIPENTLVLVDAVAGYGTVKSGNFVTEHNFVTTAYNFWSGLARLLLIISNFCEKPVK
jgi:hypothetical protein